MDERIRISAVYNGGCTAAEGDAVLELLPSMECTAEDFSEYHAEVTNRSDQTVFLETVRLLETDDLSIFGIGAAPYDIYRSGRHKNDMPGVFTTGKLDERLEDVSSVMAETGDSMENVSGKCVVSDHLTLIKGGNETVLAVEFLTGRDQMFQTLLELDDAGNLSKLTAETVFHIALKPGQTVRTETIRVAAVRNADEEVQAFARRKAELYGSRNRRHPAVFCTWYYYGLTVTYEDVKTCLNIIKDRKLPYEVFQVDEGWEVTLGEYVPNQKFPVSMKQIADEIKEAGYIPGIWSSPFVAHETASIWKTHPEWILRDRTGAPYRFPMNDTEYYVFDITDPSTYAYFTELYRMFTEDWGYQYHKLDFTRAAVIYEDADFFDKSVTLAQAYYRAVKAIREGMGEDAFFLMCGGLYDPIIGLVDAQRTGSDVLSMWSSNINKGGKTAPYTIRQSILRSYMNEWWANDPDALMIRKNEVMERGLRLTYGLLNDEEVKTSIINQFAGGGIMCQTEPLDKIGDDRLMEIRHLLPVAEMKVRPFDILAPERFPASMDVFIKKTGVHCVCMINWSDTEEKTVNLDLSCLALPDGDYAVCDFYSREYRLGVQPAESVTLGTLKPHGATVVKVERMEDRPVITVSDGHYSMGAECRELRIEGGTVRITGASILPVETNYTVWLPDPWRYHGNRIVSVKLSQAEPSVVLPLEKV